MKSRRMFKKPLALLAAVVMAYALLPALSAAAAPPASATLANNSVFPGPGQTFTVTVRNDANPLSLGALETINYVRVTPPAVLLNEGCPTVTGWTCTSHRNGYFDFSGGAIAAGSSLSIPFTGDIGAPNNANQVQPFVVDVSDQNGANNSFARLPGMNLTVKVLQLVANSIEETSPNTDELTTRGQTVQGQFRVLSYARQAITATPTVNGVQQATVTLPGIGNAVAGTTQETPVPFSVSSTVALSPRTTALNITASIASPGASAGPLTGSFTAQAQAYLVPDLDSVEPKVVRSSRKDANGDHVGGFSYDISLDAEKLNIPTMSTAPTATLQLTGPGAPTGALPMTITWSGGSPWAEGAVAEFSVTNVMINSTVDTGVLNGTLTLAGGTDSNLFPYSQTIPLPNLILIDNIAPIIQNFDIAIPSGQFQVKAGDTLQLTGDIDDPQNSPQLDLTITGTVTDKVTMQQSDPITVHANPTFSGDSFSVSYTLPATVPFNLVETPLPEFALFTADASIADVANNQSTASGDVDIDNAVPTVRIATLQDDEFDGTNDFPGARYYIEVELTNDYNKDDGTSLIAGGCNPLSWDQDETSVIGVYYSNGASCQNGVAGPDNKRVLALLSELDPNFPYQIEFDSGVLLHDDMFDGAANEVLGFVAETITTIAPPNPLFSQFERYDTDASDGSYETVTVYGDAENNDRVVHVNAGGPAATSGSKVPHITVGAASTAFEVHVRDELGNTLYRVAAPTVNGNDQTTLDLPIPALLGSCENGQAGEGTLVGDNCELTRFVTFFNPNAANGSRFSLDPLKLTVVLDQVTPEIRTAALNGSDAVDVGYNEALAGGRNANQDWATVQLNPDAGQQQDEFLFRPVNSVDNGANGATRVLSGLLLDQRVGLYGVSFLYNGSDPLELYEDLAGNRTSEDVIFQS